MFLKVKGCPVSHFKGLLMHSMHEYILLTAAHLTGNVTFSLMATSRYCSHNPNWSKSHKTKIMDIKSRTGRCLACHMAHNPFFNCIFLMNVLVVIQKYMCQKNQLRIVLLGSVGFCWELQREAGSESGPVLLFRSIIITLSRLHYHHFLVLPQEDADWFNLCQLLVCKN